MALYTLIRIGPCLINLMTKLGYVLCTGAVRRNKCLHKPNAAEIEVALKLWQRYATDRDGGRSIWDRKSAVKERLNVSRAQNSLKPHSRSPQRRAHMSSTPTTSVNRSRNQTRSRSPRGTTKSRSRSAARPGSRSPSSVGSSRSRSRSISCAASVTQDIAGSLIAHRRIVNGSDDN